MNNQNPNTWCRLTTSNRNVCDPTQSQLVQSRRPGSPCSWMRCWRGFLLSALSLLLICGSASAQLVNVVGWQNGILNFSANVATVTGWDLDDSTTVLVAGLYGDNSSTFTSVTFGGVPPTGFMNVQSVGTTRSSLAYWINPDTTAGQSLVVSYTSPNPGYYWVYQLSNVNTNAPVVTSGPTMTNASTTSVTTLTNNSFVISYYSVNNAATPNTVNSLTPNPPLIQTGTTRGDAAAGASMASATNTAATAGLEVISWNALNPPGTANQGVGAIAFQPLGVGAPIVNGSISPAVTAPGANFILTVTINPFHYGNITNVNVDLSSIGGSAANALVQSSDPNVWTNSFIVPGGAPLGTTSLTLTANQDAIPITGTGSVAINIAAPSAPVVVRDTIPTGSFNMYVGQGVTFSATFSAPGFITYQWLKSGDGVTFTNIPGAANSTYTIPSATLNDAGYYELQASNFNGSAVSSPTHVTVNNSTPVYTWSAPIPFAGLSAEQILTNFPSTNKIAGAMVAQSGINPISVTLTNAGNRPVVFAGEGNWASLQGGASYALNVNTNKTGNSSFNSALNVGYNNNNNTAFNITLGGLVVGQKYQVQLFALDNRPGLTPDGSIQFSSFQDPTDANGITSEQFAMADNVYMLGTFTATSNAMTIQQNLIASAGNFNCLVLRSVGWEPPPYITIQPKNTNNFIGTNVSLTGRAAADTTIGNPTITYQWAAGPPGGPYVNLVEGGKYAGVTNVSLTVSNLAPSDATQVYVLRATDGGGTATSREAHIYVQSPPILPTANSFGSAVLALTTNRLIGFWQLNETNDPSSGLLTAYDASGKGHSGTYGTTSLNGFNAVQSPQPPLFGGFATNQGALQTGAGGTSDATSVVNLPPLNTTNGVDTTICMWIKPTDIAGNLCGLLYNRGPDQCGFGFSGTAGGPSGQKSLGFYWGNANGEATYTYDSGLFPVNNLWNFVVLVIRTNAATFYLNYVDDVGTAHFGKAADTASRYTQQVWSGSPIWIGGDPVNAGAGLIFPGSIADVAMFNSALTDDQINQLFTAGYQVAGFPAAITQQPPSTTTDYIGYTLQIIAQTGGTSPITNQWKFNGTNLVDGWSNGSLITGSTSNVLTILHVSTNWQGIYNLAVTNSLGGMVSADANVTILAPVPPPAANLVGRWFGGAPNLTDISGHLPGTHDGTQITTNGVPRGTLTWSSDLPPNATPGGSSLVITNTGVLISNSSTVDSNYQSTFDDGISTAMSITFWAKGWPGQWNPFVSKYGEATAPAGGWQVRNDGGNNLSPCWTMRGNPGTVALGTAVGGNAEDLAANSLTYGNDGKWHFYCATYDVNAGQRILYVDGSLVASTTGQGQYTPAATAHLTIGARDQPPGTTAVTNLTTGYYTGKIYDVRVYNTAISDVQQAYLAAPPALPAQTISVSGVTQPAGGIPGQMVLSWLTGGKLLQATNLVGPWETNQSATPPYTVITTNNPGQFFRILFP
jgi:hypothetical protein